MTPLHPIAMESAMLFWVLIFVMSSATCVLIYALFRGRPR